MDEFQWPDQPEVEPIFVEELVAPAETFSTASDVDIYLSMEAYQAIATHSISDLSREIIGLLLGSVLKNGDRVEVTITQALRGQETLGTGSSVQLSYESWKHFIEEKAARYTDQATVGWYHTHPGFGTFLSGKDELIHTSFFAKPWQVALVVDPIRGEWTFFRHQPAGTARCERFMLIVPDGAAPDGGVAWQSPRELTSIGRPRRGFRKFLHSFRPGDYGFSDGRDEPEPVDDASRLGKGACQRQVPWSRIPLHLAAAGQWIYWMPSGEQLMALSREGRLVEYRMPHYINAMAPAVNGTPLYLLAIDDAEIWVHYPNGSDELRSHPIEIEEDADSETQEDGFLIERYRLASLGDQRLVVCATGEMAVLDLNAETDRYQVVFRRTLPRDTSLGLRPFQPLPVLDGAGVVLPDLLDERLVCYGLMGKPDDEITVDETWLRAPMHIALARQRFVILGSTRERIVVTDLQGRGLRQFRLSRTLKHDIVGLLGAGETVHLILSDGLWRCDRLLQSEG